MRKYYYLCAACGKIMEVEGHSYYCPDLHPRTPDSVMVCSECGHQEYKECTDCPNCLATNSMYDVDVHSTFVPKPEQYQNASIYYEETSKCFIITSAFFVEGSGKFWFLNEDNICTLLEQFNITSSSVEIPVLKEKGQLWLEYSSVDGDAWSTSPALFYSGGSGGGPSNPEDDNDGPILDTNVEIHSTTEQWLYCTLCRFDCVEPSHEPSWSLVSGFSMITTVPGVPDATVELISKYKESGKEVIDNKLIFSGQDIREYVNILEEPFIVNFVAGLTYELRVSWRDNYGREKYNFILLDPNQDYIKGEPGYCYTCEEIVTYINEDICGNVSCPLNDAYCGICKKSYNKNVENRITCPDSIYHTTNCSYCGKVAAYCTKCGSCANEQNHRDCDVLNCGGKYTVGKSCPRSDFHQVCTICNNLQYAGSSKTSPCPHNHKQCDYCKTTYYCATCKQTCQNSAKHAQCWVTGCNGAKYNTDNGCSNPHASCSTCLSLYNSKVYNSCPQVDLHCFCKTCSLFHDEGPCPDVSQHKQCAKCGAVYRYTSYCTDCLYAKKKTCKFCSSNQNLPVLFAKGCSVCNT